VLVHGVQAGIKVGALVKIEDSDAFRGPLIGQMGIVIEVCEETLPRKLVIAVAEKESGRMDEIEVWEDEVEVVS